MSQTNISWEYNGNVFELDLQDAETTEKYESAFSVMGEEEKALPKDGAASDFIRAYHGLFVRLYDNLFGAGAGVKVLGDKANSRICNESYESFLEFVAAQKDSNARFKNDITSKYSQNRAQRRAEK